MLTKYPVSQIPLYNAAIGTETIGKCSRVSVPISGKTILRDEKEECVFLNNHTSCNKESKIVWINLLIIIFNLKVDADLQEFYRENKESSQHCKSENNYYCTISIIASNVICYQYYCIYKLINRNVVKC